MASVADKIPSVDSLVPKTPSDCFKFLFLLFSVVVTFAFEVTTVIPYVHPGDNRTNSIIQGIHFVNGLYLLHVVLGNLFYLVRTDTSIRNVVLSSTHRPDWRFCSVCEANCPPRSFHCSSCDVCVLRRDHHCEFAGKCVGYRNYRYFIGLLIGLLIGSGYSLCLNQFFIWTHLGGFTLLNLVRHTFPLVFMLLGRMEFTLGIHCFICVIDLCGFLFVIGLLLFHSSLMLKNQTNFEKTRGINKYDLRSWRDNVVQVMGESYVKVLLTPFASSFLPGDGINFPSYQEYRLENEKHK